MKAFKHSILGLLVVCSYQSFAQVSILSEDFQSGIPVSFTLVDNDGLTPDAAVAEYTAAWISVVDPEDNMNMVAGSTSFFDPTGEADRWLITPQLVLGTYGNSITWDAKSHDASFPDDYLIMVSTSTADVSSFTDTIGLIQQEYAEWTSRSVDLSAEGYNGQTIYIAFRNNTNNGFKLYIDDISVTKEDPASVSVISQTQVAVYPNPTSDLVYIQAEAEITKIILSDLSGKLIQDNELSTVVKLTDLPNGIYLLSISTTQGSITKRIVKQ
jgi:hypothetical protein